MKIYNKMNETNYKKWVNKLMKQEEKYFNNERLKNVIGIEWDDILIDFANYVDINGLGTPLYAGNKVFLLTLRK